MKRFLPVLGFLPVLVLAGCTSQPSYSKQKDLIQPLLQTEFNKIILEAPEGSRVGIDWCFDLRFEEGPVSAVSDWVQRQIEKLLVDSKKFVMVSRRYLVNIQREQDLQASSRIDETTAVSICRNLGLSYLIIPEITQTGTLSIQLIDAETDQIHYVTLADFY
jgi:hypothetical protein